jgi:hypothetical protein
MKKDDATIPMADLHNVRKSADLLLRRTSAYGRFPTPVDDVVSAAKLEISRENALDKVFLSSLYRRLPNAEKLVPDSLKRAVDKVLGLLDRTDRRIHLDPTVHPKKCIFLTLHETAHDALPEQRKTYALLEDSESELDPDTKEQFERQANCFASEVLFQLDSFTAEAAQITFGIRVSLDLSSRYSPSLRGDQQSRLRLPGVQPAPPRHGRRRNAESAARLRVSTFSDPFRLGRMAYGMRTATFSNSNSAGEHVHKPEAMHHSVFARANHSLPGRGVRFHAPDFLPDLSASGVSFSYRNTINGRERPAGQWFRRGLRATMGTSWPAQTITCCRRRGICSFA